MSAELGVFDGGKAEKQNTNVESEGDKLTEINSISGEVAENYMKTSSAQHFESSLEDQKILPKLTMSYDSIANADGQNEISKTDIKAVIEDKSGKYDVDTKLAAKYMNREFENITQSDDIYWFKSENWNPFSKDPTIDRIEIKFHISDVKVKRMALEIEDYLNGKDKENGINELEKNLKDGNFTTDALRLMWLSNAMKSNGTAGMFIKDQLQNELKPSDQFRENHIMKHQLNDLAVYNHSPAKRLAAKLALQTWLDINRADSPNRSWIRFGTTSKDQLDAMTLVSEELDQYSKLSQNK